jgi:hypothetical protein
MPDRDQEKISEDLRELERLRQAADSRGERAVCKADRRGNVKGQNAPAPRGPPHPDQDRHAERPARGWPGRSAGAPGRKQIKPKPSSEKGKEGPALAVRQKRTR